MIYLINDPAKRPEGGKKHMAKRPVPKGFSSWKTYMAHIRGFKKGGRKRGAAKYQRNDPDPRRNEPARKGRKGARKGRRYHRNPMVGLPGRIFSGAIDAVELLGGKAVARAVPSLVGMERESTTGLIVQTIAAGAAGIGASYINPNLGKMVLAGGFSSPLESLLKKVGIPYLTATPTGSTFVPLFGEEEEIVQIQDWPRELAGYVEPVETMGEEDDYASASM